MLNESISQTWNDGLYYGKGVGRGLTPHTERGKRTVVIAIVPGGTVLGPLLSQGLTWDPEVQKDGQKGEKIQIGNSTCSWWKCVGQKMAGSRLRQNIIPLLYLNFHPNVCY